MSSSVIGSGVIEVSADSRKLTAGIDEAKKSLKSLGIAAGDATKGQSASIDRYVKSLGVAAVTAGKTATEVELYKLALRGATAEQLKSAEASLKMIQAQSGVNAALKPASEQIAKMGKSAKETAFAMRGVPAQFTDIFTSLQGGQAPLTVLLQQGGQLKDMFGGVGNAARAMGGYVLGLLNPFTIAAGAAVTLAVAYTKGAAEGEAFNKSLILTGNAAGTTIAQLSNMAKAVSNATGGTIGAAADALAQLAGNGNIASAQFEAIARAAVGMEKTTGVAVAETVKQFAELGKDPLTASLKLNESTRFLTLAVYEQIRALTEQGRVLEAGVVAQNAYASVMEQRTPALLQNLGYAETAWKGVASAAKGAWDAMLNIGRTSDPLAEVRKQLAYYTDPKNFTNGTGQDDPRIKRLVASLKEQLSFAGESDRMMKKASESQAERNKLVAAQSEFDKGHDKYLSKSVQMQRELTAEAARFAKITQTPENIAKHNENIAGIKDKFKEAAPRKGSSSTKAETEAARALKKAYDDLMKVAQARADLRNSEYKSINDFMAAEEAARVATVQAANEAVRTAQDEYDNYGKTKSQIAEVTLARLNDRLQAVRSGSIVAASIEAEIEAQKRLIEIMKKGEGRDIADKALEDQKKVSADYAQGLHDDVKNALSTAFQDTKNPIQAFGDALGNVIFTRVSSSIADAMATQILDSGIAKGVMAMFGFKDGGAFNSGGVQAFASGGTFTNQIVNKATPFKFASGGSFRNGVMGEAGPEAVMPLTRGPDGKLGVQASGGQAITVIQNFNVGDVASVSMVRQAVAGSEKRIAAGLGRSMSYGGALA